MLRRALLLSVVFVVVSAQAAAEDVAPAAIAKGAPSPAAPADAITPPDDAVKVKASGEAAGALTASPTPDLGGPSAGPVLDSAPTLSLREDGLALEDDLGLGWTLFRTFIVLGLVVLLAWLTLNVGLRRLMGIRAPGRGRSVISVLERVQLDPRRSLFVIKAADEVLLVGGTETQLTLLAKLEGAAVQQLVADDAAPTPALQLSPFLQKLLKRKDAPPAKPG